MNALPQAPSRRRQFLEGLAATLAAAPPGALTGLVVVRVPRIHDINVNYGYDASDRVVDEVRTRLRRVLRDCDLVESIEDAAYALVLPGLLGAAQVELAASRVLQACRVRHALGEHLVSVPIAVGAALSPSHADDADGLLRCAEIALAQSRDKPAGYGVYDAQVADRAAADQNYVLEVELAEALEREEFFLCLQPKMSLRGERLVGAEALLRWRRGNGEMVSPDVFIPLAERNGHIVPITLWTLNAALRACGEYFARFAGFSVAVNLSPLALTDPDIFDFVSQAANIWCTEPGQLTLELTEGALIEDPEAAIELLDRFHRESIRLSIDDFGTGYSSLSQLGRLSVGELKIDKSFVFDLARGERSAKIVRSIIDLAHNFDMTVVAEGIEDANTLRLLSELGCDYGQGYYIGRPMTLDVFETWVQGCEERVPLP